MRTVREMKINIIRNANRKKPVHRKLTEKVYCYYIIIITHYMHQILVCRKQQGSIKVKNYMQALDH